MAPKALQDLAVLQQYLRYAAVCGRNQDLPLFDQLKPENGLREKVRESLAIADVELPERAVHRASEDDVLFDSHLGDAVSKSLNGVQLLELWTAVVPGPDGAVVASTKHDPLAQGQTVHPTFVLPGPFHQLGAGHVPHENAFVRTGCEKTIGVVCDLHRGYLVVVALVLLQKETAVGPEEETGAVPRGAEHELSGGGGGQTVDRTPVLERQSFGRTLHLESIAACKRGEVGFVFLLLFHLLARPQLLSARADELPDRPLFRPRPVWPGPLRPRLPLSQVGGGLRSGFTPLRPRLSLSIMGNCLRPALAPLVSRPGAAFTRLAPHLVLEQNVALQGYLHRPADPGARGTGLCDFGGHLVIGRNLKIVGPPLWVDSDAFPLRALPSPDGPPPQPFGLLQLERPLHHIQQLVSFLSHPFQFAGPAPAGSSARLPQQLDRQLLLLAVAEPPELALEPLSQTIQQHRFHQMQKGRDRQGRQLKGDGTTREKNVAVSAEASPMLRLSLSFYASRAPRPTILHGIKLLQQHLFPRKKKL